MRNRLLFAIVGIVALILALHDIPLARHLEVVERDRLVTRYERDAFILAGQSEEHLDDGTAATSEQLRRLLLDYAASAEVEVVLTDADGVAVVSSDLTKVGTDMTNREEIDDAINSGIPVRDERFSTTLGQQLFSVAVPVLSGNHIVGALRISAPDSDVAHRVNARIWGLAVVAAISLAIAVFVAWLTARSLSRPIENLRDTTNRFASGDLGARADTSSGPTETTALAKSFNMMAERQAQLLERQRSFAGTASHQLRTPLTALRLRLDQLGDHIADDPATDAALQSAVHETDRLSRMIEGLLALARTDDDSIPPERVDVSQIAAERVEYWEPLADEHEVRLVLQGEPATTALAIPGAVEQIIDNFVANALEASPPGTTVCVGVHAGVAGSELRVCDQGPGMSPDDRERAFDRFWRGEASGDGGTGLGLAIVRQLVQAGGGAVDLRESDGGGVCAVVVFAT